MSKINLHGTQFKTIQLHQNKHQFKKVSLWYFLSVSLLFPPYSLKMSKDHWKNQITKVHKTKEWKNQRTYQKHCNSLIVHKYSPQHCSISTLLNQNAKNYNIVNFSLSLLKIMIERSLAPSLSTTMFMSITIALCYFTILAKNCMKMPNDG